MKQLIAAILVAALLILPVAGYAGGNKEEAAITQIETAKPQDSYQPLTDMEIENWLDSISWQKLMDFIRRYDYVEHAQPEIVMPNTAITLDKKGDLHIDHLGDIKIYIGHLEYSVEVSPEVIEDFENREKKNTWLWIVTALSAGFAVGVVVAN